jgi:lipoprotein-anchoring transpeptidase ErfK/SrfK
LDTLKTAIVVVLLLVVLYGVYTALNKPEAALNIYESLNQHEETSDSSPPQDPYAVPQIGFEPAVPDAGMASVAPPVDLGTSTHSGSVAPPSQPPGQPSTSDVSTPTFPPSASADSFSNTDGTTAKAGYYPNGGPATNPGAPPDSMVNQVDAARRAVGPLAEEPSTAGAQADASRPASDAPSEDSQDGFASMWQSAQAQLQAQQWKQALFTLTLAYRREDLTLSQRQQLLDLLDPLAAKVIYSTEHHFAQPHIVARGESLMEIARQYNVPWVLLSRINGVKNPDMPLPGTPLKVVEGPFRAELTIEGDRAGELTLFAGHLYAGRFPVSIGQEPAPVPGDYKVLRKQAGHPYYGAQVIAAGDPRNPYGTVWMDLGNELSIHGSPDSVTASDAGRGCVSLSPADAQDVFGILAEGCQVSIRR